MRRWVGKWTSLAALPRVVLCVFFSFASASGPCRAWQRRQEGERGAHQSHFFAAASGRVGPRQTGASTRMTQLAPAARYGMLFSLHLQGAVLAM